MGRVPARLATELQESLGLERAIETGTFEGRSTLVLSRIFPSVVTIELSPSHYSSAALRLSSRPNIRCVLGDSREQLPPLIRGGVASFLYLDGHWSGGTTGGEENQCPLTEELVALRGGHPDDCIVIDDVQMFLDQPPGYDPQQWPSLAEVLEGLRASRPGHHVAILGGQVVAVPQRARAIVDRFAFNEEQPSLRVWARSILGPYLLPDSAVRRLLSRVARGAR